MDHQTVSIGWQLLCYRRNGNREVVIEGTTQTDVYAHMCSSSFADDMLRRGYVVWEMRQGVPHVD